MGYWFLKAEINALHISVEYLTNCDGSEEEEEEANDSLRRICLVGWFLRRFILLYAYVHLRAVWLANVDLKQCSLQKRILSFVVNTSLNSLTYCLKRTALLFFTLPILNYNLFYDFTNCFTSSIAWITFTNHRTA